MSIFFKIQHSLRYLFILLILSSCSIFGEIVPIKTKHSYQGEFQFTQDSHVIIEFYVEKNSEESEIVKTNRIDNITEFPIPFSISLDSDLSRSDLNISAKVFSRKGDEVKVGDFITETVTSVPKWGSVIVEVVGVEHCNAPHAGGFCTHKE